MTSGPGDPGQRSQPGQPPDLDRYRLDEAANERIFREEIVADRLVHLPVQDRPVVVFLLGQQGAGKTRTARQISDALATSGPFETVDSDLYKPYHPAYRRLLHEDDRLMAAYVGPDGTSWMAKVQDYLRTHRANALVHETAQRPGDVAATMTAYRDAGYRVEVVAMGVARAFSEQGILHRYAEQVADRGHGRLTLAAKADAAYTGILAVAAAIDTRAVVRR